MNKFVTALLRLLGGLTAAAALALPMAVRPEATPQEPILHPIWTFEDVALSGGYNHALALDSLDRPHLLYVEPDGETMHYAVKLDDGWHSELITDDISITHVLTFDLVIGPDDAPCLVYATDVSNIFEPLDSRLVYGCRGPEGWALMPIDDGGQHVQLALHGDQPHIALSQDTVAAYLWVEDGQWHKDRVTTDSLHLRRTWLMVDSTGRAHVIYSGHDGTFKAVRLGPTWTKTPFTTVYPHVARLDAADRLWVLEARTRDLGGHPPIYFSELFLARPDGADDFVLEKIEEGYDFFYQGDLVLAGETPHVAYAGAGGALTYMWWTTDGPQRHALDAAAEGVVHLAVGSDGQPRVSFVSDGALRLATRRMVLLDESLALPVIAGQ